MSSKLISSRTSARGDQPIPLKINTQQLSSSSPSSKFYQDAGVQKNYKPHPLKMVGSQGQQEILVWSDYPFSIWVRGFPRDQELYLQAKLDYFEREEEMIADMVCNQEIADKFDLIRNLTAIQKSYRFAQKVCSYLKHTVPTNVNIPMSYRLPDLFPKGSPLACKKFPLDENGRNSELEQAIQAETVKAMAERLTAIQT